MRKFLKLLMGTALSAGLLSGCGSSGGETKEVESSVVAVNQESQSTGVSEASEEEITRINRWYKPEVNKRQ